MVIQSSLGIVEQVLPHLPYGGFILDPEGGFLSANRAALKLLSLQMSDVANLPVLEAIPSWKDSPLAQLLQGSLQMSECGGVLEFEIAGPQERWYRVSVSAVMDAQARREGWLVSMVDMTEQIRLRARVKSLEHRASIGKLVRGVAHELSNPLDGVLRYTHLALEQIDEESPVREYLIHVKEGLDRMVKAVRAFLEFSRQATAPVHRAADVNRLVEDALLLVHHRAKFQQIQIVKQFEDSLPTIRDAGIQYAVVNLVRNAFDAMPQGGVLTMRTRRQGQYVEVAVQDTGTGIPEEMWSKIFEPFFSTKPFAEGSGLGLLIAREAVERCGGRMNFTSQPGAGTTFHLLVPAASEGSGNGEAHGRK